MCVCVCVKLSFHFAMIDQPVAFVASLLTYIVPTEDRKKKLLVGKMMGIFYESTHPSRFLSFFLSLSLPSGGFLKLARQGNRQAPRST